MIAFKRSRCVLPSSGLITIEPFPPSKPDLTELGHCLLKFLSSGN